MSALMALMALLACLVGACDPDGERPRYASGLSGMASVRSLDPGAVRQVCQSYRTYVETYVDLEAVAYLACLPGAVLTSTTSDECERRLDRCVALFPEPITVRAPTRATERCTRELATCDATVAELEQCVNVDLDFLFGILDDLSCHRIDQPGATEMARRTESLVSVCADLGESCSSLNVLGPD